MKQKSIEEYIKEFRLPDDDDYMTMSSVHSSDRPHQKYIEISNSVKQLRKALSSSDTKDEAMCRKVRSLEDSLEEAYDKIYYLHRNISCLDQYLRKRNMELIRNPDTMWNMEFYNGNSSK